MEEEPRSLGAERAFGGQGVHSVRLSLGRTLLRVEVEAHPSAQLWRGDFDATAIEALTRKTGNFKQFGIFCSMLEAALMQSSASVELELLTYADLETLWNRKVGAPPRPPPAPPSPLHTKRYLILIYSAEFDRIHYPLPLSCVGGPHPAALLRRLRDEVTQLRDQHRTESRRLRDKLQRVLEEKRTVEDELAREKNRYQRENRQLTAKLAEAQASTQRLRLRVRSLEAELASYKRGPRTAPHPKKPSGTSSTQPASRSASRESRSGSRGRFPSRSPSPAGPPPRPATHLNPSSRGWQRRREAQLKNQRLGGVFGSASPVRSRGRSSSAESIRRSALSSGSEADERPEPLPHRRTSRTRRPLSALSCNSPGTAPRPLPGHKPSPGSVGSQRRAKESCYEEPSAELAEIDARLQALQEYMDRLGTRT
ncbi:LOW QUALITY PROTEIN: coiled-coil domain-containing protein 61 [Falco rusticolus]|uniref:LOW QUALITY PROTEIN: coiled-coil domain-containing protein 61 n=1 Tax=Falco rusticolus TaxID=120794 RepID=UPI00188652AC|nr:LOW QUALITY PROTEIN: coiled-coil domain-containing protein 61 [Falco rusticolus]